MTIRRRSPDEARILLRLKRLAPQRQALTLALVPFADADGKLDSARWEHAFGSDDAQDIYHVFGVTGAYQALVNHLVEMLHVGARLGELEVVHEEQRPSAPRLIDAVKDDGGLTASQADVLKRFYGVRNMLQHASLEVEADEVYDAIVLLQKTLSRFATSYVRWMEGHGVELLPRSD